MLLRAIFLVFACSLSKLSGFFFFKDTATTEIYTLSLHDALPISYLADEAADWPDAIGRAVPDVELRLTDDAGEACGAGEVGELWIRSPAAMDGYLRSADETRAVMREGWFRTGDLARISAAGFVTIVGRKKELILRGGY